MVIVGWPLKMVLLNLGLAVNGIQVQRERSKGRQRCLFTLAASNSYLQMTPDRTLCLGVLTEPKPLPMKSKRAALTACTISGWKPHNAIETFSECCNDGKEKSDNSGESKFTSNNNQDGKYWPLISFVRTSLCFVRTARNFSQIYSPIGPCTLCTKLVILRLLIFQRLQIINNYWTTLSKISWFVSGEQIKLKAEAIIDLRDTDKSRSFAITEFNNCFIIRSPSLFSIFGGKR